MALDLFLHLKISFSLICLVVVNKSNIVQLFFEGSQLVWFGLVFEKMNFSFKKFNVSFSLIYLVVVNKSKRIKLWGGNYQGNWSKNESRSPNVLLMLQYFIGDWKLETKKPFWR